MEAESDLAAGRIQHGFLLADGPAAGQAPLVGLQRIRRLVIRRLVLDAPGRRRNSAPAIADIGFGRLVSDSSGVAAA